MVNQTIFITDWWIFGATIFSGLLTATATLVAVIYTHKKTIETYEKDKDYQYKKDKLVIIKPYLKFCSFGNVIDELITYNNRERVLVLSSPKDGFDFYDDSEKLYTENHRLFCVKNESRNNLHALNVNIKTKLTTESNAIIEEQYNNNIKLLRGGEEFILRVHNNEQRKKLWEQLDNNRQVELWFDVQITYSTEAKERIIYRFESKIQNIPETKVIEGKNVISNNAKITIIKDEYQKDATMNLNNVETASVFRNLQDNIVIDRANYLHKKIGAAQAEGLMSQMGTVINTAQNTKV
ncbi:MAG: hypothetical protein E7Z88_05795 [Cyanobacteria bacterium SIG27]|nr:hypothetical protein [Cyanobacteria bacterium SIG27]